MIRKIVVFFVILILFLFTLTYLKKEKKVDKITEEIDNTYNSNLLENIKYIAKDSDGNEYIIKAEKGEIDLNNSDVISISNKEVKKIYNLNLGKIKSLNFDENNIIFILENGKIIIY